MSYDPGNRVRTRLVWGFPLSRGFSPAAGQLIAACCADSTLFGAAVDAARDGLPKGRRLTRPSESASPTSTIIGGTEGSQTRRWREKDSNPRSPGHGELRCRPCRTVGCEG